MTYKAYYKIQNACIKIECSSWQVFNEALDNLKKMGAEMILPREYYAIKHTKHN